MPERGSVFAIGLVLMVLLSSPVALSRELPFSSREDVRVGFSGAACVQAADLDGDGGMDLVGAAPQLNTLAWWSRQGPTNWQEHIVTTAFPFTESVTTGDLDGDGDLDVLATSFDADDVAWWENVGGAGTNWLRHTIDSGFGGARAAAVGDMDRDGDLDVVAAAVDADDVAWWENQGGTGLSWQKRPVDTAFDGANDVAVADVDGDGDLDILGAALNDDEVAWWSNDGGLGLAWTKVVIEPALDQALAVAAADVDGDGDLDAVAAGKAGGLIGWWENLDGSGQTWFGRPVAPAFELAQDVQVADLDQDGDTDLLGVSLRTYAVKWWENLDGTGATWIERTVDPSFDSPRSVCAADLDRDGDLDVAAAAAFSGGKIGWWQDLGVHRGARFCRMQVVDGSVAAAASVVTGDLDRNGIPDVAGAAGGDDRIFWWGRDDPAGTNWARGVVADAYSAAAIAVADLDGDGRPDVAAGGDAIDWWANGGMATNWTAHAVAVPGSEVSSLQTCDLDRDGRTDLLVAMPAADAVAWWGRNGGSTNWTVHPVATNLAGTGWAAAADVNGDGTEDVVGCSFSAGQVWWWENGGGGSNWLGSQVEASFAGASQVAGADVDGDGDTDVVGVSVFSGQVAWWENADGQGGSWTKRTIGTGFSGGLTLSAGDLDLDGDLDVLAATSSGRIAWWENLDGTGLAWRHHEPSVLNFPQANSVALEDLDRDGDLDLVAAAGAPANRVAWWANASGQVALDTTDVAPGLPLQGGTNVLLNILFGHLGRTGDSAAEWASFRFRFGDKAGQHLLSGQAQNLIDRLRLVRDDGSHVFEDGQDDLVAELTSFSLLQGEQTITFAGGDPLVRVEAGTQRLYFVVADLAPDAGNQVPSAFTMTHVTDPANPAASSVRDVDHGLQLQLACDGSGTTRVVQVNTEADVRLGVGVSPAVVTTNGVVSYFLTVSNRSPDTALQVAVSNVLPAGVTFNSGQSGGPHTWTGSLVVVDFESVLPASAKSVTLVADVKAGTVGGITNRAAASTISLETNTADNAAVVSSWVLDTDGDGMPDFADPDRDGDGMENQWETDNGLNPTNAADALVDSDSDQYLNLEEFIADTGPFDSNSYFRVNAITYGTRPEVAFDSAQSRLYTLRFSDDLSGGSWSNVPGRSDVPGNPTGESVFDDPNPKPGRSYRLHVRFPQ